MAAGQFGRCLCTYARLYTSRSVSLAPSLSALQSHPQQLLSSSPALRGTGCSILPGPGPISQIHTSRWLSADSVDFNEPSEGYLYATSHEWASLDGNIATIGISNYAQEKLGDVVFVELPEVGTTFEQGDQFGVLESVKAAADVYCPVNGTVVEVNSELEESPELINNEPYDGGWIMKLEVSKDSGADELMSTKDYEQHVIESAV